MTRRTLITVAICAALWSVIFVVAIHGETITDPTFIALHDVGMWFPGAAVVYSQPNKELHRLARQHADYMASICVQGHQGKEWRLPAAMRVTGCRDASEICAQSWSDHSRMPLDRLAWDAFHDWYRSSGHWRTASRQHRYWGGAMARGRNGIWYACVIAGD